MKVNIRHNLEYAFNLECSIKLGSSPSCTNHTMGRRSTDESAEEVTINYEIEAKTAEIEQFGNIVTMKSDELQLRLSKFLLLIAFKYM